MGPAAAAAAAAARTFTKEGWEESFPRFLHIIREAKQRNRLILISRTAGWWHVNAASATTLPSSYFRSYGGKCRTTERNLPKGNDKKLYVKILSIFCKDGFASVL